MRALRILPIVLLAGCATTSTYQLRLKPYELQGTDFPLPSGLRLFFQEDAGQPSVAVAATVGVGGRHDPAGREGMAHLVEHLCFRAMHADGQPNVWDRLKLLGGVANAFTTRDDTTYFTVAPADALQELLSIEAMRLMDPLRGVTEEILAVEREVVRNELRQRYETAELSNALLVLGEMLYPEGHPYHRSVIGSHDSLKSITLEDVRAWVKQHYRPENMTIVVTGAFEREKVGALLGRTFPRVLLAAPGDAGANLGIVEPKPRIAGPAPEPPPPANRAFRRVKGGVSHRLVLLAWSIPGAWRGRDTMVDALAATMSTAIGEHLFPESFDEKEQIEGLGCSANHGVEASEIYCFIEPTEGEDPERIASKAIDGLWNLWDSDSVRLRERQLAIGRSDRMADTFLASTSLLRAVEMARSIHFTARPDVFSRTFVELGAAGEVEIREFAYRWVNRDRAVAMVVEPWEDESRPAVLLDREAEWTGAVQGTSTALDARLAGLTAERIAAMTAAPAPAMMKVGTLPNGLRVVLQRHGGSPFLQAALFFGGGRLTTTPAYLTDFASVIDDARDPREVAGRWFGGASEDAEWSGVETPSGNLDAALDLLATRASTSSIRFDSFVQRKQVESLERRIGYDARSPSARMAQEVWKALAAGHPLATPHADPRAVGNLSAEAMEAWLDRVLVPSNATLVVVGDIEPVAAFAAVQQRFGSWRLDRKGQPAPVLPPLPAPPARTIVLADRPEATQTEVFLACQLPDAAPGHDAARDTLEKLLGDELSQTIREQAGASYGIQASVSAYAGGAATLSIEGQIANDHLLPALKAMLGRIGELKAGSTPAASLNAARLKLAMQSHTRYLGIDAMLRELGTQVRLHQPVEALTTYPARLGAVDANALAAQLERCAGHEIVGLVGPAAALAPRLEALGAPVTHVGVAKAGGPKAK